MTQTTRTIAFVHALRDFEPEARRQLEGHNLLFLKSREAMAERIAELDVVVTGYMWDNGLIPQADRLAYLQTVSSGTEAFDLPALKDKGIAVCNARGVNATTTAEHGIGLMMAMSRQLHRARDNQHAKRCPIRCPRPDRSGVPSACAASGGSRFSGWAECFSCWAECFSCWGWSALCCRGCRPRHFYC